MPDTNLPVGRQRIPGRRLLLMDGFAIHGRYWARDEPRHLEGLLREWLPLAPGTPASPRAAQQPDGVHP